MAHAEADFRLHAEGSERAASSRIAPLSACQTQATVQHKQEVFVQNHKRAAACAPFSRCGPFILQRKEEVVITGRCNPLPDLIAGPRQDSRARVTCRCTAVASSRGACRIEPAVLGEHSTVEPARFGISVTAWSLVVPSRNQTQISQQRLGLETPDFGAGSPGRHSPVP